MDNQVISMSCSMSFFTSSSSTTAAPTAYMTWSGDGCTSDAMSISNSTYVGSKITINVHPPTVQSCTCTTGFNAPVSSAGSIFATNAPAYVDTWVSPDNISVTCKLLNYFVLDSQDIF